MAYKLLEFLVVLKHSFITFANIEHFPNPTCLQAVLQPVQAGRGHVQLRLEVREARAAARGGRGV